MVPYLILFSSVPLLLHVAHNVITQKNARILFEVCAVALPCLLAGLRSSSVGTDMVTYGEWGFVQAQTASWAQYYGTVKGWHPLGYSLFTWLVGHFTRCRLLYFGLIQALCAVPAYLSMRRVNPQGSWAGMLVYLLIIYPFSLNGMKQSIACGLGALMFWILVNKRYISFVIAVLFACLFHPTALFLLLLIPVHFLEDKGEITVGGKAYSLRIVALSLVVAAFALLFVVGRFLIPYVAQLRDSFDFLVDRMRDGGLNKSAILLMVSWVPLFLVTNKVARRSDSDNQNKQISFFGSISLYSLAGFIGLQLDLVALSMARLAYYGLIFLPLFIAFALGLASKNTDNRKDRTAIYISIVLFLMGMIAFFMYQTVICRVNEVFPFTFY